VKWLILALLLWATPAEAQQGRGTKNWRVGVEYLNTLNGVAFCRDEGSFYLVKGGLSAMEKAATEAHEATHIKQHGRFKDCKAFYKYYDTPVGKLETEAEAFAAGLCVQQQMGADPVNLKQWYLSLLIKYYVPGTQIYEASQIFSRYERCP
jgi:Zn-dependent peptidase ImmA (M78 family)